MDSFEFNKIIGAILGTLIVVMGTGFLGEGIFEPRKSAKPGYDLPGLSAEAATPDAAAPAQVEPIAVRLASADPKRGEADAKKCAACHRFDKGGPNAIGPNLFGVVGREKGSHPGFSYSSAMEGKKSEKWTYEEIDKFITNPKSDLPGTKMTFAGLPSPKDRADTIAYLRSLADSPEPLPEKP